MTTEHSFRGYYGSMGDYLFPVHPDNSYYDAEARQYISELLHSHAGNINSAREFLALLETFVPESVQYSIDNPSWSTGKQMERLNMAKGLIESRVRERFASELSGDITP
ncbi:TPA: hypothetical protein M4196_004639 [Klebsiella variicola]|uniref:hypothetical protein n=1 Tax=Klebsiella TaxID=570 RepID=UPI0003BEFC81|nr:MULTISPECIES: hypothetical protein [Klebsiella]HDU5820187.1 hypothetical protein [Klebsiella quasipneumoniae subsp. similipneumoniae]HEP0931073.1 hypothetical protein [Klebsiella pneumoniae subsp. pneumoniae]EKQ1184246.1 hypothetical protein [Klebsiella pneumoniae]ESL66826.1 hypothetical protein L425_05082 [Klebsiella quasipneumoniae subsp. quasipneumoniae]MDX6136519.1 hypothetical protein [Klebsiella sp. CN_Kp094]